MDLTESIAPKSDQLNAEDLLTGPRTFTIESVTPGSAEQPVDIHLVEAPGRAYRPSKTMRRIMVIAWGKETGVYAGYRLTLYRDPSVKFGGSAVGGIKISHLSHIDKRLTVSLTETRGKRAPHTVEPLPDAPAPVETSADDVAACTDVDVLRSWWQVASGERRALIKTRVAELTDKEADR